MRQLLLISPKPDHINCTNDGSQRNSFALRGLRLIKRFQTLSMDDIEDERLKMLDNHLHISLE